MGALGWGSQSERFGRMYSFSLNGKNYEVVLGLGQEIHEVYQNRVLVSDNYNLLFYDSATKPKVPHLKIRLNSPDFDLPFGRHRLRNESVLVPLARYIRQHILKQYIGELFGIYKRGSLKEFDISPGEVQDIAASLIMFDDQPYRNWCKLPIFNIRNRVKLSLEELRDIIKQKGILYLEKKQETGMDYSIFDVPVLSLKQPEGGLEILSKFFKDQIVNLDSDDVVLGAPKGISPELGPREEQFKNFLGFHPDLIRKIKDHLEEESLSLETEQFKLIHDDSKLVKGLTEESDLAHEELSSISWQVNYLVEKDGKTPSTANRFIFKNNTVILNLYNSDIQRLVQISETAPALSGHYALAMCLAENGKILPYLTAEAREELILMDAMTRCGTRLYPENSNDSDRLVLNDRDLLEFMHNIDDSHRWKD